MIIPGNAAPSSSHSNSQHDLLTPPFKSNPLYFILVTGFIQSIPWGSPLHSSASLIHCWSIVASEQQMAPLGFLKENYYNEVGKGGCNGMFFPRGC